MERLDVPAVIQAGALAPVASIPAGPIYGVDNAVQRVMQSAALQQNSALHGTVVAFNWWGGAGVICFAALLWLGARAARRRALAELGLRGAEAIAVSAAIGGIVKGLAGRARPFIATGEPWHWEFARGWTDARYFSMLSGHTTVSFAFAAAMSVATAHAAPAHHRAVAIAAFASAVLVAFARVYLNQHWVSDVIVGALLGSCTGYVIARWHARHPRSAFDQTLLGSWPEQ